MTEHPQRKLARRLGLSAAKAALWLVYVLALFQLAGLVYFHLPWAQAIGSYGYPRDLFVPLGGGMDYGYRPGYRGAFSGGAYNDVAIDINGQGYRDREFGAKAPGVTRIAVLGDSVVFGAGVAAQDRFTERLEAVLNAAGGRAEVYNLGVNSYGFSNYVGVMGSEALRELKPDVVVVGFVVNDLEPSGWPRDVAPTGASWRTMAEYHLYNLAASRLFCQLRDYVHYFVMALDPDEQYHTKYMRGVLGEFTDPALLAGFARDRARARELTGALGARYVVALMPEINVVREPGQFGLARTLPKAAFAAGGVPVCDLYDAFAAKQPLEPLFLPHDDMHFSPAGHALVAEALARCLAP